MATEPVTEFAPAKVNLTLHVIGRGADGYHMLDSLVVFAGVGDRVTLAPSTGSSLTISGPQAAVLPVSEDNLVLRAARLMGGRVAITLEKVLPVAAGIGGGSADAAATLRAMVRLGRSVPEAAAVLALGADVPVCLAGSAARMTGVGEAVRSLPPLPEAWLVLVNPGVTVETPAVFRALEERNKPPMPEKVPEFGSVDALAEFLTAQRNDLQVTAIGLAPVIRLVLTDLVAIPGCLLARMSGSGATCFGLFRDQPGAEAAATRLRLFHPEWWVVAAPILGPLLGQK